MRHARLELRAALDTVAGIGEALLRRPSRSMIGIAGGPGAGKSTFAGELLRVLAEHREDQVALIPMDGFHMRHARLEQLGLVSQKGMPHTFEAAAFVRFLKEAKSAAHAMTGPSYSRKIEDVVDDGYAIGPETRLLIVEGNYLLLDTEPWSEIRDLMDFGLFLDADRDAVRARLLARHAEEGLFTKERNERHVELVDLKNYDLVRPSRGHADLAIEIVPALPAEHPATSAHRGSNSATGHPERHN